jgi:predicted O-methyltransferase YrrM
MILTPEIREYLIRNVPERPAVMQEMEAYAKENRFPIVGPQVGRLLYQLVKMSGARQVLELGSGFGYSAYWFSLAMGAEGSVIMTDGDPENKRRALDYLERAGLKSRFDFRVGDALTQIADLPGPFHIVFNDVDKEGYPDTIDPAAVRLRPGGLFITDNLLWSGRVVQDDPAPSTRGVLEFTRRLLADSRFFTTILPVRDGIALAVRV